MPDVFHDGEKSVQQRVGVLEQAARVGRSVQTILPPGIDEHLRSLPFVIIASVDETGQSWASLVTGEPGFMSGPYPNRVTIDAEPSMGDALRDNLKEGAPVGLLAIDLATRTRVRVNGSVEMVDDESFSVRVREAFVNCRKYIQRRRISSGPANSLEVESNLSDQLTDGQRDWLARADTFFIASSHAEAGVDASHRGGLPGFVRVMGDNRIEWTDYPGNNMYQTLGNLAVDPRAGLLFVDFERGATLQLTGRATLHWGEARTIFYTIERVMETVGGVAIRADGLEYSPHNPPE